MEIQATTALQYGEELALFCRRMVYNQATADEIVQDVMAAWCRAPAGELENPRAWLYRVARNRCLDVLRKLRPEARLSGIASTCAGPGAYPLIDPATTPAGKAIKAERAAQVHAAVQELDDDLRCVIVLRFWQGLTREEIADVLELSRSGVDHRLSRAVRAMASRLKVLDSR